MPVTNYYTAYRGPKPKPSSIIELDLRHYLSCHGIHLTPQRLDVLLRRKTWDGICGDLYRWGFLDWRNKASQQQVRDVFEAVGICRR